MQQSSTLILIPASLSLTHLYNSLLFTHISNLVSEINEVYDSNLIKAKSKKNKTKRKEIEWFQDIQEQVKKLNQGSQRFQVSIHQNIKSGSFLTKNINSLIVKLINLTYRKKIQKVLATSKYINTKT